MLVETFEQQYSKAYATLLNCWKFLRALSYQVEKGNLLLDGFCLKRILTNSFLAIEGTVIIDRDVTMDNQQPSPIFKIGIVKYIDFQSWMPFTD